MTSHTMAEWLRVFNVKMKHQIHHILFSSDNTTCHPHIELSNVQLVWFPPNTTYNHCQPRLPMDLQKPISILDTVIWIAEVKKQMSPPTLQSNSQKAWFSTDYVNDERTESKSINSKRHSIRYIWKYWVESYVNSDNEDEARTAPKEINEFLENHQQSKEEKDEDQRGGKRHFPETTWEAQTEIIWWCS